MQYTICNIQYTIQYTIYNIPNITTSKGNRVIGFPQVQKYSMRIFKKFLKNHAEIEVERLVPARLSIFI